jgi:hypothetical protein
MNYLLSLTASVCVNAAIVYLARWAGDMTLQDAALLFCFVWCVLHDRRTIAAGMKVVGIAKAKARTRKY